MKNYKQLSVAFAVVLALLVAVPPGNAGEKGVDRGSPKGLPKTTGTPVVTYMDINKISTVVRNNGTMDIDIQQQNSGLVYPKGSGKTAMFESGPLWGAQIAGDPQVRVGGSAYSSGLQPGKLLSPGVAEDPNLPKNRIYRVRPDYKNADLGSEITDQHLTAAEIRAQYDLDWKEWPAGDGAPYTDVNKDGVYDPNVDIPGFPGADMTIWFVANDNNSTNTTNLYGTQPMGIEVQTTIWGYAQAGALGNMIFKSFLLINKGNLRLDSMYVCQWADPDLGNAEDDLAGCDTTLSLGFIYNGNNIDQVYTPLPPPAAGFDFFQGPRIPAPGSSAIFRGKRVNGYKTLPMTSFFYFIKSDPGLTDPTRSNPQGATQMYNFMRGRIGLTGQFFQDPQGNPSTFCLSGDPVTGSGWVDGRSFPPGDRRLGLSSGPITMAPGDTQEVVVAELAAGAIPGVDRKAAVGLLKFYDKVAQLAYDNFFQLPSPPAAPKLTVTELDRQILLNWGTDTTAVNLTESSDNHGFKFQGYNVYQLPSASATVTQGRKIAVFDIADGVTRILDQVFDTNTGVITGQVAQLGLDSGVKRYIAVTGDAFNGGSPLINGIRYYFAVSAYSYSPDPNAVPNNLENPLAIFTVMPHAPDPGVRYNASNGDTLSGVTHPAGIADGGPLVRVVDPSKLTGDDYEVRVTVTDSTTLDFEGSPLKFPSPKWSVFDKTKNAAVTSPTSLYGPSTSDVIADGLQVGMAATPFWTAGQEVSAQTYTPANHFNWAGANAGLAFFQASLDVAWNFLGSGLRPFEVHKTVEVRFDAANGQSAYNFRRTSSSGSAGAPYAGFFPQPFKVFDVTNPAAPRQIDFVFMEADGQPTQNNVWAPGEVAGNREYFNIIDEDYTGTAKPEYAGTTLGNLLASKPALYAGWYVLNDPAQPPYQNGDVWRIAATQLVTVNDRWAFTTAGKNSVSSADIAKQDVQKINVFPNPYYGVNTEELNKYNRFVLFSHLPNRAVIRIFNLAGVQVRQIIRNSSSQFERWDLANESGLPVGSGLYIAHIEMPDLGITKILKLAIIQEQQILDRY